MIFLNKLAKSLDIKLLELYSNQSMKENTKLN